MPRFLLALLSFVIILFSFSLAPINAANDPAQTPPGTVSPGAYLTDYAVRTTTPQLRDNYSIYARLKGIPVPAARTVNKPVYKVGDQETFKVFDLEQKRPYNVTATAVAITPHVYMFLDVNFRQSAVQLAKLAEQFEDKIYPTTRRFFGEEPLPGIDNDVHMVILNTPLKLAAAYYSSDSSQLQTINPSSNEREMFFIGLGTNNFDVYLSTLAHEFQHMIHQNALPNQDLWMNEGNSILAQVLNGYSSGDVEAAYLNAPGTQLNTWACSACGTTRYYGAGYTWLSYLSDRFGFNTVRGIAQNGRKLTGFQAVDYSLYANGQPGESSQTVFKQFVAANYLNRRSADPVYNYKNISARVERFLGLNPGETKSETLNQWSAAYYNLVGGSNGFTLDFKGAPNVKLAGTGAHSGQQAWWSNRGDDSNTTLTRSVDLTGLQHATLKFWTWFDIEASFDWAYVEVSTDDGQTWQILPGQRYTTDLNPTNKAYGPGMTGQSTPQGLDLSDSEAVRAEWVQETFDLSKFAGQRIKLRLEYLTDEGFSRQGALYDDFEIPEIGWKDDVETGMDGWETSGFIRSNVTLPQGFWVQVIRRDGPCADMRVTDLSKADNGRSCVQELVLDANNAGRQNFPFRQAVVVVSPYATRTLVPANYRLTLQ